LRKKNTSESQVEPMQVVGLVLVGVLGLLVALGVNGHIKTGLYSSVALLIQGLRRKEKR
jgi:hypothetical protein